MDEKINSVEISEIPEGSSSTSGIIPINKLPVVSEKGDINVETILHYAGDFGRYQILLMILFSIINVLSAFHYFAQTFITVEPYDFKCSNLDSNNFTADSFSLLYQGSEANETKPITNDRCKIYNHQNSIELVNFDNSTKILGETVWVLNDCSKFDYDNHFGYESIVTELNWLCKDSWKGALGQSTYFFGALTGTFLLGIAADKWGRIKALIIAFVFGIIGNGMTVLSKDLELFAVSRFVAGFATDTNFVMMYIIVMEYIRPRMRTFGLNICIGIFYCLGCSIVPWLAVVLRTWRRFLISGTAAMVIVPFYYLILPESASWLLAQGRADEALEGFLKIAQINGKIIPDDVLTAFKEAHMNCQKSSQGTTQSSLKELFRRPKLRRKMVILIFKTMTLTLCYDAISRNVKVEGISPFLIFSLGSLTILPACIVILIFQDRIGRKALFFLAVLSSALLTSTSGLANAFIPKDSGNLSNLNIVLAITARLCVVVAFNSGSQYAAELIPTIIRGRGVALIHVVGYAASFLSPILLYLSELWPPLPDLVLGILCFICALATLLLPETLGRNLPVTLDDGEIFGEDEKPCEFFCCSFGRKREEEEVLQ